jgi:tellurite resistance protein
MIIFGTRGITTTPERGNFHCPRCQTTRPYNLKRVRRFFTLYFIPVIPLDKLGEYVECPTCQGTYSPEILTYDPAESNKQLEALFFVAVKHVMIGMLLADGEIDDSEVMVLQEQYAQITGSQITEDDLREEIAVVRAEGRSPVELVQRLAPQLNDNGKEIVLRAAYAIANADGTVGADEQILLEQIGNGLGLTRAHLSGILQELLATRIATAG